MSDVNYFGQNCKYFTGQWETCDVQADTESTYYYKEFEPVLYFCNHPGNKEDREGNCRSNICPLLLQLKLLQGVSMELLE